MIASERGNDGFRFAGILLLSLGIAACGSSSPSTPTSTGVVASVALNTATLSVGGTAQATVTLSAAASTGGTAVTLSSSSPAVASVPSTVTVQAGATTATVTVTGVAPGAATITATANGSSQSAAVTVTANAVLSTISLSAATVVGGNSVFATVGLNAPAPAGGAVVTLSGADPVTVPATVTVLAGASTATFAVQTRAVGGTTSATIGASYGGGSASAVLSVTKPLVAIANFGVTGPTETETCEMGSNTSINCTFNGTTSAAPGTITAWDWTYAVANTFSQTTAGAVLTNPTVDCTLLPPPPLPAGTTFFTMKVTLVVHDNLGNVSAAAVDNGVRLFPLHFCGY